MLTSRRQFLETVAVASLAAPLVTAQRPAQPVLGMIFPPADVMAKCEYPDYLGPEFTRLLDEAMTRLRAA